jgi:ribonuclease BN (tRNA processing enzyme)
LRVTVLGKSPAWQDAAGACSGYLAQADGASVLLDCGNGVFSKLRGICDYVDVDAVVITHMHADHFLDLVPFSYALRYAPRQQPVPVAGWPGTDEPARPRLYLPIGGSEVLRRVVGCWGTEDLIDSAFDVHEYAPEDVLSLAPLTVRFCEVPHYVATFAVELSCDEARFTYGADCRPNDELVGFARDTDLLLIEATLPRPERDGTRGHLTAHEAGEHGKGAGARRLVLTHYSDELDVEVTRAEGADGFGGPVGLATEGAVYDV